MGKVITIANHKGGVGKTTTALSLGVSLSRRGKKVLLIDLDAQCNLTSLLSERGQTYERTIFESLCSNKVIPVIHITDNMKLSPASLDLVGIEKALTMLIGDSTKELTILRGLIEPIKKDFDYILIDCPPSLGILTKNALISSDGVILTLTAESLPTIGIQSLIDGIQHVQKGLNKNLKVSGILLTRYNRRKLNRIVEESLRASFGDYVFKTKIRESVDIMEAPLYRKNIFDYAPDSKGAEDYNNLTDELLTLEKHNRL